MAKGGYRGGMPMGGMNQMQMMKQAQKMQAGPAEDAGGTGGKGIRSDGGRRCDHRPYVSGKRELKSITIDPEAVDPDDVEMLQDMIVAAVNEAMRKAEAEPVCRTCPS